MKNITRQKNGQLDTFRYFFFLTGTSMDPYGFYWKWYSILMLEDEVSCRSLYRPSSKSAAAGIINY